MCADEGENTDYKATSWPQLAWPGLALARTVGLGPSKAKTYGLDNII